ncbi:hypothetical protein [Algoriphagus terrigena]|uniref:hypothetical protein n=1 Tax=Algoriphagus terrigena TaxID=344884 RepID=UPI000407AE4D|nr:hypothetical protein [Algoriphagus terrigena]
MAFNEDSRVKIPAILHLIRLGFTYIPQGEQYRREDTNIFQTIFTESILKLNPHLDESDIKRLLDEITLELGFDDLGRKFFHRLTSGRWIQKNLIQNQHLSSLRDWQLPMLMNGQVTVEDAEERIEPKTQLSI